MSKRGERVEREVSMAVMPGERDSSWRGAVVAANDDDVDDDVDTQDVAREDKDDDDCTVKADDDGAVKPFAGVSDDGNANVTMVDSDRNLMVKGCLYC